METSMKTKEVQQKSYKILSGKTCIEIIRAYDLNSNYHEIAKKFNCGLSDVLDIIDMRNSMERKRFRQAKISLLIICFHEYLTRIKQKNNLNSLCQSAGQLCTILKIDEMSPDIAWIGLYKKIFSKSIMKRNSETSTNLIDIISYCKKNEVNLRTTLLKTDKIEQLYYIAKDEKRREKIQFFLRCLNEYILRLLIKKHLDEMLMKTTKKIYNNLIEKYDLEKISEDLLKILEIDNFTPTNEWIIKNINTKLIDETISQKKSQQLNQNLTYPINFSGQGTVQSSSLDLLDIMNDCVRKVNKFKLNFYEDIKSNVNEKVQNKVALSMQTTQNTSQSTVSSIPKTEIPKENRTKILSPTKNKIQNFKFKPIQPKLEIKKVESLLPEKFIVDASPTTTAPSLKICDIKLPNELSTTLEAIPAQITIKFQQPRINNIGIENSDTNRILEKLKRQNIDIQSRTSGGLTMKIADVQPTPSKKYKIENEISEVLPIVADVTSNLNENVKNVLELPSVTNYSEALEFLRPLEEFVMLEQNFRAIGLISQLEKIFKNSSNE